MLNPKLHLNIHIFDKNVKQVPTRNGYGKALISLGKSNPNIVAMTADLVESTRTDEFQKQFPKQFIECGIAEQNMVAIAAGLAVTGKIPFIASYATFSPGKNWETIRTTVSYNNANVKIAGHHAGVMTGPDGPTHQATEDIAIIRPLPNFTIFVPCDAIEAEKATHAAAIHNGPVYIRFSRDISPIITTEKTPYIVEKIQPFWISKKPRILILAMGYMVYHALVAAKRLERIGIDTIVANVATIKPFDKKGLLTLVKKVRGVVTVEDHQTTGGLGGVIAEFLATSHPMLMSYVGLHDTFAESGSVAAILKKYNMDAAGVVQAVKRLNGKI